MTIESDGECIHGLGPIAACTICNGRDRSDTAERSRITHTFPARYPGTCAFCRDEIVAGELIGRTVDERIVHVECT